MKTNDKNTNNIYTNHIFKQKRNSDHILGFIFKPTSNEIPI